MFPALRTGLASTLETVLAWWRARASRDPGALRFAVRQAQPARAMGELEAESQRTSHAEDALRRFLSFALDDQDRAASPDEDPTPHHDVIAAASAALANLEVQAKYLPRRPSLLPKLLSTINSDQTSMRELAAIIGDDPALMGNLVRLANSAFYRGVRKSIESLERAVTLVGTDGIRGLIATALLHPVMSTRRGLFATFPETIWEQTLYAADAAEMHAIHVEKVTGFGARLLALLHGLATNAVFRIVRDECLVNRDSDVKPAVVQLLANWTSPTSVRIATAWEMPNELQNALDEAQEAGPLRRSAYFGRLAGAQVLLVKRGVLKESAARATVLAGDDRRMQIDRVWQRLIAAHLTPR
jgi:HD-like signal output (HDOD) protein